jgi:hypothetical protein
MERPLKGYRAPARTTPGVRIEPWVGRNLWEFAEVSRLAFAGEPDTELFPCFLTREGCLGLMIDLSTRPGFIAEATLLARADGTAIGTLHTITDLDGVTWVWNLGVIPGWRGLGVAGLMLATAMVELRRRRIAKLSLEVTADNAAAVSLYRGFGFRRVKTVYRQRAGAPPHEA